jgi:hypothetical protein
MYAAVDCRSQPDGFLNRNRSSISDFSDSPIDSPRMRKCIIDLFTLHPLLIPPIGLNIHPGGVLIPWVRSVLPLMFVWECIAHKYRLLIAFCFSCFSPDSKWVWHFRCGYRWIHDRFQLDFDYDRWVSGGG